MLWECWLSRFAEINSARSINFPYRIFPSNFAGIGAWSGSSEKEVLKTRDILFHTRKGSWGRDGNCVQRKRCHDVDATDVELAAGNSSKARRVKN